MLNVSELIVKLQKIEAEGKGNSIPEVCDESGVFVNVEGISRHDGKVQIF